MKIFITGASGYIGGSVADKLAAEGHHVIGLVRTQEKGALLSERGIEPLVGALDDPSALQDGVGRCDAVINSANSDHYFAVQTLIESMTGTGKTLIHTSGSSIACDDALGEYASDQVFSDDTPLVPMLHRVPRREIDRIVRVAGIQRDIRASVICPSMVYGKGLGLKTESDQIPKIIAKSRERKAGVYIGKGLNIWSNVFIQDLANLYLLALEKAPSGSFFYAENGESSFKEIAEIVSVASGFGGRTESWKTEHALGELGGFARVALASNARVRSVNARSALGWSPSGPSLRDALTQNL